MKPKRGDIVQSFICNGCGPYRLYSPAQVKQDFFEFACPYALCSLLRLGRSHVIRTKKSRKIGCSCQQEKKLFKNIS